jgi:hypothetical protein
MTEEDQAVLRQTLIREVVGLTVMVALLWYLGPGKLWMDGIAHRVHARMHPPPSPIDVEVEQFSRTVTRWDYEQAALKNRQAGRGGPCGCG